MLHDHLERKKTAYGGSNFIGLVEQQLRDGRIDIATRNLEAQIQYSFELANLYWGQGNIEQAQTYLELTLDRYERLVEVCAEHNWTYRLSQGLALARFAACFLGKPIAHSAMLVGPNPGYEWWFKAELAGYCLGSHDFDVDRWRASSDVWRKRGYPKYRLLEFDFYADVLTGAITSTDEIFNRHRRILVGRTKRRPDSGLIDGYSDHELVIDHIFAAVLKRIGWQGAYRHSWPSTDAYGSGVVTRREPDRFIKSLDARGDGSNPNGAVFADEREARQFIDRHLTHQVDEEGNVVDPRRKASQQGKVKAALTKSGWEGDAAALDLMQTYRIDQILNDSTHLNLCDPLDGDLKLGEWTEFLRGECGLPDEFIGVVGNYEAAYPDLEGGWHLYRKSDAKVYLLDREEWGAPESAIAAAREGVNVWPSFASFVAWWVSQHLHSRLSRPQNPNAAPAMREKPRRT